MKYRQTFREALNDVEKNDKPEVKVEKSVDDKDETIRKLQDQIQQLTLKYQQSKIDKLEQKVSDNGWEKDAQWQSEGWKNQKADGAW